MKKLKSLFILAISSLLILSACNSNIPSETPNKPNTPDLPVEDNVEEKPEEGLDEPKKEIQVKTQRYIDTHYTVQDGKVIYLQRSGRYEAREIASTIDNAVYVSCQRFVFCEDGKVVDLKQDPEMQSKLDEISAISKIVKIEGYEKSAPLLFIIYTEDGKAYFPTLYTEDGEPYFSIDFKIDAKKAVFRYDRWYIVNHDGTISGFSSDFKEPAEIPEEIAQWTDIVDLVAYGHVFLGLKNDGTVVSYRTDFTAENIVMIDILYSGINHEIIPIALTSEGKLIFGEHLESEIPDNPYATKYGVSYEPYPFPYPLAIKQAETITDIVEFDYIWDLGRLIFVVRKSDGSLWTTFNNHSEHYDPEKINIMELFPELQDILPARNDYGDEIKTFFGSSLAIKDGKVLFLAKHKSSNFIADEIDDAVYIHAERFVERADGIFVDLMATEERNEMFLTDDFIDSLNNGYRIWKIETPRNNEVEIYGFDGSIYAIDEKSDYEYFLDSGYPTYEEYLQEVGPKERKAFASKYEKPEYKKEVYFNNQSVILNKDGTVSCDSTDVFENWTDVKDIVSCENIVLGLKNDGTLLAYGTDFSAENVAKIDIINNYGSNPIPVALTADGKLIFGEYPELEVTNDPNEPPYEIGSEPFPYQYAIKQAENFTDVVDFTYIFRGVAQCPLIILVQKSDGSFLATYNDYYNSDFVGMLGIGAFLCGCE